MAATGRFEILFRFRLMVHTVKSNDNYSFLLRAILEFQSAEKKPDLITLEIKAHLDVRMHFWAFFPRAKTTTATKKHTPFCERQRFKVLRRTRLSRASCQSSITLARNQVLAAVNPASFSDQAQRVLSRPRNIKPAVPLLALTRRRFFPASRIRISNSHIFEFCIRLEMKNKLF